MNQDGARLGKIQKVVHVPSTPTTIGRCLHDLQGYGILRDQNGKDVFFIDTSVCGAAFAELKKGTQVRYLLEPGPLSRAAQVWVQPNNDSDYAVTSPSGPSGRGRA